MERVRGRSLSDLIDEHARAGETVPLSRALRILAQVAEGLAAVHAAGLLHLDVKPENIMIEDGTGRPVLVDFGLASRGEDLGALRGGTPGYMPPEQALRAVEPLTERSDVYALAATAFTLLTGAMPFGAGGLAEILGAQIHGPAPRLSVRNPDLAHLDAALAKGLAVVAAERHESCAALVQALATQPPRALGDGEALARSGGAPRPPGPSAPGTLKSAGVCSRPTADTIIDAVASAPTRRLAPPVPPDDSLSILVIDPDPAAARLYRSAARIALFGKRLQVTSAEGADGALAAAAKGPPDLAILRYSEAADGIAALEALRGVPGAAAMRALVLSSPDGLRVSAFRFSVLGVKHFLPMPTSLPALVETLGTLADEAGWRDVRAGAGDREELA
jgi:serine/threonine-protein kinase